MNEKTNSRKLTANLALTISVTGLLTAYFIVLAYGIYQAFTYGSALAADIYEAANVIINLQDKIEQIIAEKCNVTTLLLST